MPYNHTRGLFYHLFRNIQPKHHEIWEVYVSWKNFLNLTYLSSPPQNERRGPFVIKIRIQPRILSRRPLLLLPLQNLTT